MHSVLSTPQGGLPHSEIPRSKPVTGSFGLIAGYHVLHRLSTPRHPPCALRPVIIPTRHRRIGTSLSQAMLMSQLVRLTLHITWYAISNSSSTHIRFALVVDSGSSILANSFCVGRENRPANRLESCSCQRAAGCPFPANGMPLGLLRRKQRGEPRSLAEPTHLSI